MIALPGPVLAALQRVRGDSDAAALLDAYARHLRILGRAEATVETYLGVLHRVDRGLPSGLDHAHHDGLLDAVYVAGRKPATRALYRATLREFYTWAAETGWLATNPAGRLPAVKVPRRSPQPVSDEQLADILARAREPYRTWYLLAAGCGLRCVEIANLDREHVTAQRTLIHGKGGKERVVPTHPQVWAAVSVLPPGPVARTSTGGRATRLQVRDRANYHLQVTLGLPDVHAHRLRHWYGTATYRSHGEFVAQQLLGHESPATTAQYAAVASSALEAAVAALPLPAVCGD